METQRLKPKRNSCCDRWLMDVIEDECLTWWVECDDALQQRLQLCLQAAEADAASLFQIHQGLDAPAHIRSGLQRLLLVWKK